MERPLLEGGVVTAVHASEISNTVLEGQSCEWKERRDERSKHAVVGRMRDFKVGEDGT